MVTKSENTTDRRSTSEKTRRKGVKLARDGATLHPECPNCFSFLFVANRSRDLTVQNGIASTRLLCTLADYHAPVNGNYTKYLRRSRVCGRPDSRNNIKTYNSRNVILKELSEKAKLKQQISVVSGRSRRKMCFEPLQAQAVDSCCVMLVAEHFTPHRRQENMVAECPEVVSLKLDASDQVPGKGARVELHHLHVN